MDITLPRKKRIGSVVPKLLVALLPLFFSASYSLADELSSNDDYDSDVLPPVYQSMDIDDVWDVYQRAKSFDAIYLQAISQHEADVEVNEQAFGRLLPSVSLDASRARTHQEIKSSDNTVFGSGTSSYNSTEYGISFSQALFDWDIFSSLQQSDKEVLKANALLQQAEQELILRVAERYLTVLAAQDNLEFSLKEEQAVKEQADVSKARLDAKLGREADYLEAKARFSSVYATRITAENFLDDTFEAIREISGASASKVKQLRDDVALDKPQPNVVTEWVNRAMAGNLRVRSQRFAMEASKLEIQKQKSGHYPTLELVGGWHKEDVDGSLFGGGSDVDTADVAVQFKMPLYMGGQVSSKVKQVSKLHETDRDKLREDMRAVSRETRSAFLDLDSATRTIASLADAIEAQLVVVETKRKGYPRLYTSKDVLDSERDLYSVKRDWAKARYDYLLSSLRLKSAEGSLQTSDLSDMNALFETI